MIQLDERYVKDASIVAREIVGEVVLVPVRRNANELESIFTLNEAAAYVWKLMDGQHTLAEISAQLVEEYEVEMQQAQQDVLDLAAQLVEIRAIVKV